MKIHVHKVVQLHNSSYKAVYMKYGQHIDHKGFIEIKHLKNPKK